MKVTNIAVVTACVMFVAGCNQSSSDKGTSGQNGPADTGQGTGAPSTRNSTLAPDTNSASTSPSPDSNAVKPPDNTGRNVRDRSDAAVTPGDQGESKADINLVSRVRQAITKNDQLSTTAKNIKVIESNGKVTLRGPVNSTAEKEQIVKTVQGVEGVTSVDDQLEVKNQ